MGAGQGARRRLLWAIGTALCLCAPPARPATPEDDPKPTAEEEPPPAQEEKPKAATDERPAATREPTKRAKKYISPDDGWLDLSAFLDEPYGFAPIAWPVTEPAVGYGAGVGLAFIGRTGYDTRAGFGRPNVTAVAGMYTDNGSWGGAVADWRQWKDERLQTMVAFVDASVNLDFYGLGKTNLFEDQPLTYRLAPIGGLAGAEYRLGGSRAWIGLSYMWFTTEVSFVDTPETVPVPEFRRDSKVGSLTPTFTYDSRDSIFTPRRGTYVEAGAGLYAKALGGDDDFQTPYLIAMQYVPLHPKLDLGVRGDLNLSFGDAPFYMRPYLDMRGVPKMRYQGEHTAKVEVELRWQLWRRFSLVGFVGEGIAWVDLERFERQSTVTAGGTGFRYELARKYQLHMGVDVAFGPDGAAFYVQFGNAWMRP
jgi:hypothetical protein